jgi:hypothetical protein
LIPEGEMLEGLDAVDWGTLTHAYGSAGDVPGLLRALASPDQDAREEAVYELLGNIWHQGTVYSASAAAVPFLFELLASPDVPDKAGITLVLASVAAGVGYLEVHAVDDIGESTWRDILGQQGKSLEGELEREADEVGAVRRAVSPNLRALAPYLNDDDPEVRVAVAGALANYPEHADWSLPLLDAAVAAEEDDEVREPLTEYAASLAARRA